MTRVTDIMFRNTVSNLRFRWKEELSQYTDDQVFRAYNDFSLSEDYGNNDEKFPTWFDIIGNYSTDPYPIVKTGA